MTCLLFVDDPAAHARKLSQGPNMHNPWLPLTTLPAVTMHSLKPDKD